MSTRRTLLTTGPGIPAEVVNKIGWTSPATKYVGSRFSDVYHLPECRIAREIAKRGNLVEYPDKPAGKRMHKNCPQ